MAEHSTIYISLVRALEERRPILELNANLSHWGGPEWNELVLAPLYQEYDQAWKKCFPERSGQPIHYPVSVRSGKGSYAALRHLVLFPASMMVPPPPSPIPHIGFEFLEAWERRLRKIMPLLQSRATPQLSRIIAELLRSRKRMRDAILRQIAIHERGHVNGRLPIFLAVSGSAIVIPRPNNVWMNALTDVTADLMGVSRGRLDDAVALLTISYHLENLRHQSPNAPPSPVVLSDPDGVGGLLVWHALLDGGRRGRLTLSRMRHGLLRLDQWCARTIPAALEGRTGAIRTAVTKPMPNELRDILRRLATFSVRSRA